MADESLRAVVINGVQALVALHLEGGPGFETVTLTAKVWLEIIDGWNLSDTPENRQRLSVAFKSLAGSVARWPAPCQLKPHLLAAKLPRQDQNALPYPAEKAKSNIARIKMALAKIGDLMSIPKSDPLLRAVRKEQLKTYLEAIEAQARGSNE